MDTRDFDRLLARLKVAEDGYGQITHRLDTQAEKHVALERAVDKLSSTLESQKELRVERDARAKDRTEAIAKQLEDFIEETRGGFKDLRAFGKQIAVLAISSFLGLIGTLAINFMMRGGGG